jgi:hypothetical protein
MAENVVTRDDPHFHLGMRAPIWCFRGLQVCRERLEMDTSVAAKTKVGHLTSFSRSRHTCKPLKHQIGVLIPK